ncbi:unnamed protein product [Adineta steineri]|uniref:F-box domain-containing protein n=1 Tax=Adineta steineri TaxID=433720 RepID=A0A814DF39_9BILA|nr:unnamed protein product [Adineta steineri]CAF1191618.1 unnamed protein product [Adineta steineri]
MDRSNIHLLDLPNEILIYILKKLDNIDVLYSLFGIMNKRLNALTQEEVFSNTLNFASNIHETRIIDRFCNYILPRIHFNVKCLIVESTSMERILLATSYPNLTELNISNFQRDTLLHYLTDDSSLQYILKQQITKLSLINYDCYNAVESLTDYTKKVYIHILNYLENLEYLNIIETSNNKYRPLSIRYLSTNTFSSSNLTYLCLNVETFDDCLGLLDGRLKQLTTFIVKFHRMIKNSPIVYNSVSELYSSTIFVQIANHLPKMKCFSLIYYGLIKEYDNKFISLLRRMLYLKKLTLYLRIGIQNRFIDPIYIINELSTCMSQLQSFKFYLSSDNTRDNLIHHMPTNNIQQNYMNIGFKEIWNIVHVAKPGTYHIFTPPFEFVQLHNIGNTFPNIIFNSVTELHVNDDVRFEHEFFLRIAKAFPFLKQFSVINYAPQLHFENTSFDNIQLYEIIEYPRLTSLDIEGVDITYTEQFLNENRTYLPNLVKLIVSHENLRITTENFTRDLTRRNCANIKELSTERQFVGSKEYYTYFPSL